MSLETEQFNHPLIGNVRIADDQSRTIPGEVWVITEDGRRVRTLQRELNQTIDITPVGCQTPEGIARVQKAQQEWDSVTHQLANMLKELLDCGVTLNSDGKVDRDAIHQLNALIGARDRKQEAFLRAVAGAPEAEKSLKFMPVVGRGTFGDWS
jgi:hypothetical protein